MNMKQYKEFEAKAIVKAWKDPAFKKKLMHNPREAFKEIGCDLPQNLQVQVIEGKENTWTVVLPPAPSNIHRLSDAELQKTAAAGRTAGCSARLCR